MDLEQAQHIKELRRVSSRRLHILELQAAQQGMSTPPHILMEIEDLRREISKLDAQIDEYFWDFSMKKENTIDNNKSRQVEIVFKGMFDSLTPDLQRATIRALAAILEISPDEIIVLHVKEGSIRFTIRLPEEALLKLMKLYVNEDPIIKQIGIIEVNDQSESKKEISPLPAYNLRMEVIIEAIKNILGDLKVELELIDSVSQMINMKVIDGLIINYLNTEGELIRKVNIDIKSDIFILNSIIRGTSFNNVLETVELSKLIDIIMDMKFSKIEVYLGIKEGVIYDTDTLNKLKGKFGLSIRNADGKWLILPLQNQPSSNSSSQKKKSPPREDRGGLPD